MCIGGVWILEIPESLSVIFSYPYQPRNKPKNSITLTENHNSLLPFPGTFLLQLLSLLPGWFWYNKIAKNNGEEERKRQARGKGLLEAFDYRERVSFKLQNILFHALFSLFLASDIFHWKIIKKSTRIISFHEQFLVMGDAASHAITGNDCK